MGFLFRRRRPPPPEPPPVPVEAPPAVRPVPRADVTQLLGRALDEPWARQLYREYRLAPVRGEGPIRALSSEETGVELRLDDHGTVDLIVLHFHGDGGFAPYPGTIPGRGGTIAKRGSLWAALGRPDYSTDPDRHEHAYAQGPADRWRFPAFLMHAQYDLDGENLLRLTLGR